MPHHAIRLLIALSATCLSLAAPSFTITGMPGMQFAEKLNDLGQVVGTGSGSVAVFSVGTGTTILPLPSFATVAIGYAINNAGQISGTTNSPTGLSGFFYSNGVYTNVPSLQTIDFESLNSQGQAMKAGGTSIYDSGSATVIDIGITGYSLNDSGLVAGYVTIGGKPVAATWKQGVTTVLGLPSGATFSYIIDVNNSGIGVGQGGVTSSAGFFYSNGAFTYLPTVFGGTTYSYVLPRAINDAGQIVGTAYIKVANNPDLERAFLYDNGQMYDLSSLVPGIPGGQVLTRPRDINAKGQIITESNFSGSRLLTPVLSGASIPEPSTNLLVIAGIVLIAILREFHSKRGIIAALDPSRNCSQGEY